MRAISAIESIGDSMKAYGIDDDGLLYEINTMDRGSDLRFGEIWISRA